MPELPEVESARRLVERHLVGRCIVRVAVVDDRIVYAGVAPRRFARVLRGRRVEAVRRRGKHLWFELDRRPWPAFHFGMTGWFEVYRCPADRPPFWKVEFALDNDTRLAMPDARRLGRIRLLADPEHAPPISELGFDPLLDMPDAAAFAAGLAGRRAPIKAVLLDQGFSAGVGNWIADEVLYQARLAPRRRACDLTTAEAHRLRSTILRVIHKAVDLDADNSRFPRAWLFHHRWGRNSDAATARGEKIVHATIGGRTTAWVPAVQR
ncbi:MAG: Fpg/Nei family DNA glycosylase [Planctomycetes bacterium]|nr:Fpg/Nei family DNA glycosylase [Planctomycetota bacterium]